MNFQMGIIKVEIKIPELVQALESFKENRVHALEVLSHEIRNGVGDFVNSLLQTEMDLYLGQAEQSANKRNGIREREYAIKGVGLIRIRMPTDRKRSRLTSRSLQIRKAVLANSANDEPNRASE